jgi:FkbM family methyltransferase
MTHSVVLPTIYGQMIVNRYDGNQTQHLLRTGRAIDHDEIMSVAQLIDPGMDAVDIGTCFGAWTLAFSQRARKVYSFEPQRLIYNQLCGSLALNGIENVRTYNVAVGAETAILNVPKYNYNDYLEFGCVYFCPKTKQGRMAQEVQPSEETVYQVPLDIFKLENIGLMKIDTEGMELEVLAGAKETIERNRPILHLEIFMLDRAKLDEYLKNWNYISFDNSGDMLAAPREKFALSKNEAGTFVITRK